MSTGIGMGIAVPHVRLDSVDDIVVALGIAPYPVTDYQSLDGMPVQLIFMIAARQDQQQKYIKTLSAIANFLKKEETRKEILSCKTFTDVTEILAKE